MKAKRRMRAWSAILYGISLGLCAATADADVRVPTPTRQVRYVVAVVGLDRFPDRLVVGEPLATPAGGTLEPVVISEAGESFGEGTYVVRLWSIERREIEALKAASRKAPIETRQAAIDAFFTEKAVPCYKHSAVQTRAPKNTDFPEYRETFRAVHLSDTECRLEPAPNAPIWVTPPDSGGCASCNIRTTTSWAGIWFLVALGALLISRQRLE